MRRPLQRTVSSVLAVLVIAAIVGTTAPAASAGTHFAGRYTNEYGTRTYRGYVPSSYRRATPMPLVVGLHGCGGTGASFAALTELERYAERRGFIVLFPEQNPENNGSQCWNWFLPTNHERGEGEPSMIAGITKRVQSRYKVDTRRTFVTGISAGGAMTVIMGVTYPDLFAAIGVNAGCIFEGFPCLMSRGFAPELRGRIAYNRMGRFRRVVPTIVFHGTDDMPVPVANSRELIVQWAKTNDLAIDGVEDGDIDPTADATRRGTVPRGRSYTREIYTNRAGKNVMERYLVHGMGHTWSGGCTCNGNGDPSGPEASRIMYDFFLAHPKAHA